MQNESSTVYFKNLLQNSKAPKKQVAVYLDDSTLDRIDKITRVFSSISGSKSFSRNTLIEEAIERYLIESEIFLLEEHNIDIQELDSAQIAADHFSSKYKNDEVQTDEPQRNSNISEMATFCEEWSQQGWILNYNCWSRYIAFRTNAIDELFPVTKAGVEGWTCCYIFEKYPYKANTARAFLQFKSDRFDEDTWVKYNKVNPKFKTNNRADWVFHRLESWEINLANLNGIKAELERILLEVIPDFERKLSTILKTS